MDFKRSAILLICLLAIAIQVILHSPILSGLFECPSPSSSFSALSNSKLQEISKVGEGLLNQPEDVAFDKMGVMYVATSDGYVKRLHRNGTWDIFWQDDTDTLLGLTTTVAGDIVVCDAKKGLIQVGKDGARVLSTHVNGIRLRLVDDVVESSEGMLYFSDATTAYGLQDWQLYLLHGNPKGQLLKYDPSLNETSIVLDNLAFPNGVALSREEDYLVVCETWKYRCLKYWLKGDTKGKVDIFIDDLPGGPDNINLAPDGSFWIALVQILPCKMNFIRTSRVFKYLARTFPVLRKWVTGMREKAMVVNVASDGKIVRGFDDPTGKVMAFVTSAVEFEGHLYLGNLYSNFLGKLPLSA